MKWPVVTLGEICQFEYGKSLPASTRSAGGISVFGANGPVGEHNAALTNGATIIIGRKGSIGEVNFSSAECWPIDTTYFIDQSSTKQDLRWLFHLLKNLDFKSLNRATGVPGLNRNDAYACQIPLPPLSEQKRIAGILDQADALRRLRARALDRLNALGQAIFQEMFGEALARDFIAFGDVVEEFRYGTSNKSGNTGLPTLRIPNVIGGGIDTTEIKTVDINDAELKRLRLRDGDMLFVRTNGNLEHVGRCAVFTKNAVSEFDQKDDWIFASYLIRVRLLYCANSMFAAIYFASRAGRAAIRERSKTSAGQFNINTEGLASLPFPNIPRAQQDRFANALASLEHTRSPLKISAAKMAENFSSLQHRAFRGEL